MTVGTFDLLHAGHVKLFTRCRALGRVLIGINTDRFVEEYKARPAWGEWERMTEASKYGEVFFHDDDMLGDLQTHRPHFLVVGSDWARKDYLEQIKVTQDQLDDLDVSVVYVPRTPGISSSELRKAHYRA